MNQISFDQQEDCQKNGKKLPYQTDYNKFKRNLSKDFLLKKEIIINPLKIYHLNDISKLNFYNNLNNDSILIPLIICILR